VLDVRVWLLKSLKILRQNTPYQFESVSQYFFTQSFTCATYLAVRLRVHSFAPRFARIFEVVDKTNMKIYENKSQFGWEDEVSIRRVWVVKEKIHKNSSRLGQRSCGASRRYFCVNEVNPKGKASSSGAVKRGARRPPKPVFQIIRHLLPLRLLLLCASSCTHFRGDIVYLNEFK
jgi:hypothetical protein